MEIRDRNLPKVVEQAFMDAINDLLSLDKMANPNTQEPPLGIKGTRNEILLFPFLEAMAEGFVGHTRGEIPPFVRKGKAPLEVHVNSGANATTVQMPGIVQAIATITNLSLDVPDAYTPIDFFFFNYVFTDSYSFLQDINLKPGDDEGKTQLLWHSDLNALELRLEFETKGDEIEGSFSFSMDIVEVSLFLSPRLSGHRLLWEYGVLAKVRKEGRDITELKYKGTDPDLGLRMDTFLGGPFASGGGGFFFEVFNMGRVAAQGLAKALVDAIFPAIDPLRELVANAILALPMRGTPSNRKKLTEDVVKEAVAQSFARHSDPNIAALQLVIRQVALPLKSSQIKQLEMVSGWLADELELAALGFQNVGRIFPLESLDEGADRFRDIFVSLKDAWVNSLPANHLINAPQWSDPNDQLVQAFASTLGLWKDELTHLFGEKTPAAFFTWLKANVEPAHIVDRTRRITSQKVETETNGQDALHLKSADLKTPKLAAVPCMRYLVSLELMQIGPKFKSVIGAGTGADFTLEWELISIHDEMEEDVLPIPRRGEGATLLKTQVDKFKLSFPDTTFGDAFRRTVFLEWSTIDAPSANCHLRIQGRLKKHGSDTVIADFKTTFPITRDTGLSSPAHIVSGGKPYSTTHFEADGLADGVNAFKLSGSLIQMPFASRYDWVSVAIESFDITLSKDPKAIQAGTLIRFEALLDGVLFGSTSPGVFGNDFGISFAFAPEQRWTKQILFRAEDYNKTFLLTLRTFFSDANAPGGWRMEEINEVFHRFTTLTGEVVELTQAEIDLVPLQTVERAAYKRGARNEWTIPMGYPYGVRILKADNYSAVIKVTNKNFNPAQKPLEMRKKTIEVSLPRVHVIDDGDDLSMGEVRFGLSAESFDGEALRQSAAEIRTREIDVDSGKTLIFDGPPHFNLIVEPFTGKLQVRCKGTEKDGPQWIDPDDPLGTATLDRADVDEGGLDGEFLVSSSTVEGVHHFDATITLRTVSAPPPPRFNFAGLPEGLDFQSAPVGDPISMEYAVAWGTRLILYEKTMEDGAEFVFQQSLPGLSGTFVLQDTISKLYMIANELNPESSATASKSNEIKILRY